MTKLDITTKYFLEIITLIFISYSILGSVLTAYGQTVTPPAVSPSTGVPTTPPVVNPPAVTTPTPVLTPTPTSPNPNLQYLPQKSYVQTFAPENGIPSSTPLQALPPVQAPAPQQSSGLGIPTDVMGILATIAAGGAYLKGHFANKKADKAEDIGKENSAMNVKQGIIQEESLKLQYENMPDKGNSITDKPEIRLTEVAKMKDKAVDTATKS